MKMKNSQIPHIAETTIYDGSFATPVLEDITHGQRKNSRLFHTREENGLPFYYNPRHVTRNKISVACSILTYFRQDIMDELEPNFRVGLSNFIEKYLVKYYFRSDALYNFTLFNYYENSSAGNYNFSTNSLESVNRRLKEACGAGQLPLKKSFVKLRDFKKGYIGKFKRKVKRNQLNPRKQKTIRRQEMLEGIYDVYKNLLPDEQITEAVSTAFLIGNLNQVEVQSSFYEESPENNTFFDDSSDDE